MISMTKINIQFFTSSLVNIVKLNFKLFYILIFIYCNTSESSKKNHWEIKNVNERLSVLKQLTRKSSYIYLAITTLGNSEKKEIGVFAKKKLFKDQYLGKVIGKKYDPKIDDEYLLTEYAMSAVGYDGYLIPKDDFSWHFFMNADQVRHPERRQLRSEVKKKPNVNVFYSKEDKGFVCQVLEDIKGGDELRYSYGDYEFRHSAFKI